MKPKIVVYLSQQRLPLQTPLHQDECLDNRQHGKAQRKNIIRINILIEVNAEIKTPQPYILLVATRQYTIDDTNADQAINM